MRIGSVMESNDAPVCRRIVNGSNLQVSFFLVKRGLWRCIADDASEITDEEMKSFPKGDHDAILKDRGLFPETDG